MESPIVKYKHRSAVTNFEIEFDRRLQTGEALSGTPTVEVRKATYGETSDLTIANEAVSGDSVTFTVSGGSAMEEVETDVYETRYIIRIKCANDATPAETLSIDMVLIVYDAVGTGTA